MVCIMSEKRGAWVLLCVCGVCVCVCGRKVVCVRGDCVCVCDRECVCVTPGYSGHRGGCLKLSTADRERWGMTGIQLAHSQRRERGWRQTTSSRVATALALPHSILRPFIPPIRNSSMTEGYLCRATAWKWERDERERRTVRDKWFPTFEDARQPFLSCVPCG